MLPKSDIKVESKSQSKLINPQTYIVMYYEHQYDRMAKLEEQRLTITNIVISISAITFTFGFSDPTNLTAINGLGLPFLMILINVFAVVYINRSGLFIHNHRERARAIIKDHAPEVDDYNSRFSSPPRGRLGGRTSIQAWIHRLLVIVAILPISIFLLRVLIFPAAIIITITFCIAAVGWISYDVSSEWKRIKQNRSFITK
jgi:hypothetical protein